MKLKFSFSFFILFFCTYSYSQINSYDMVEKMGRGINLGNVLSAPIEGNWSPEVFEEYFLDIKNAGFTNVRIPIDFYGTNRTSGETSGYSSDPETIEQYSGTAADYIVNTTHLERIQEVVDWALNQGLVTVIDFHGALLKSEFLYTYSISRAEYTHPTSAKRAADIDKFRAIWVQIAERFKTYNENLLFEIINEPYFELSATDMNDLNSSLIDLIRSTGQGNSTRNIIITGGGQNSQNAPQQISTAIINSDPYLIASFHYYQPFSFTSSSTEAYDSFNWGTTQEKNTVDMHFQSVKSWSDSNNIPVTLGEFGADNEDGFNYNTGIYGDFNGPVNADRIEYHRYISEQAINNGFSFSVWDAGPKSNKSIHLRTDNPLTNNAFIGTWVTNVRDALFESGTWPLCYGPTENSLILNPGFECGINSSWSFIVSGDASASFTDAAADARNGLVGASIEVTAADVFNKVLLSNTIYTNDLKDKKATFKVYAKSLASSGQTFKLRVKVTTPEGDLFIPSSEFNLTNSYPDSPFEFEYLVPSQITSIQLQVMLGQSIGTYFLDDFEFLIEDVTTWTGAIDSDWTNPSNWSNDLPESNSNVVIPDQDNDPIISESTGVVVNDLIINSPTTLTINSGSSIIVNGTTSGNITYNRTIPIANLAPPNWYLISSPVIGQDIDSFVANEDLISGIGDNLSLGNYNNITPGWDYYQSGTLINQNFISGDGRAIALASVSDISFTGSINVDNDGVSFALTNNANGYNLIGNPYPSYLPVNINADNTNNILDINFPSQSDGEKTIWMWDAALGYYDELNQTSVATFIAPAQGFFIKTANSTSFNFQKNMQSHQTDAFRNVSSERAEINLVITNQTETRDTDIFYIDGTTTDWDHGYDSTIFDGSANEFAIYTHLVSNSQGQNLGIQSLPNNNFENMVIPVGINVLSGTQISISANIANLPQGISVYLHDTMDNSFTLLDNYSKFNTTISSDFTGIGRFFLYTTQNTLSKNKDSLSSSFSVFYSSEQSSLHIGGIQNGIVDVELYERTGKQILNTSINIRQTYNVKLPKLAPGVYIVHLTADSKIIHKKIFIY